MCIFGRCEDGCSHWSLRSQWLAMLAIEHLIANYHMVHCIDHESQLLTAAQLNYRQLCVLCARERAPSFGDEGMIHWEPLRMETEVSNRTVHASTSSAVISCSSEEDEKVQEISGGCVSSGVFGYSLMGLLAIKFTRLHNLWHLPQSQQPQTQRMTLPNGKRTVCLFHFFGTPRGG